MWIEAVVWIVDSFCMMTYHINWFIAVWTHKSLGSGQVGDLAINELIKSIE